MRTRQSGLTLIELTIAAALFAMAAIAFLGALGNSVKLDQLNRERFWAREECRRQLEAIYAMEYTKVAAMNNTTFDVGFDVNGVAGAEKLLKASGSGKVGLIKVYADPSVADSTTTGPEAGGGGDWVCCKVVVTATWKSGQRRDALGNTIDETASVTLVGNVCQH